MKQPISNRYDFVLLFDVRDGNPNGDPDAGNQPRLDPETGHGLVTDVCLKRKIRNYVTISEGLQPPFDIYVKEKAVLSGLQGEVYKQLGIETGQGTELAVTDEVAQALREVDLPDGLALEEAAGSTIVAIEGDANEKEIQAWAKKLDNKPAQDAIAQALKQAKTRKASPQKVDNAREAMCARYYDVRTFGAVMSLKEANCGQVRGPVQLTFARSLDQIVPASHTITRVAVATQREAEKQRGDNRTMGRKFTVPYALYRCHGFVSPALAAQTDFSEDDLALLWRSIRNMFELDRSAARGEMTVQGLYVFKHSSPLGNAPAHRLFDLVRIKRKPGVEAPREIGDYEVSVRKEEIPGIQLMDNLGL